ncbi:zinc ribbon domain-containing protein [Streptomyces sp. AcE210]|uniref:zinc ribbon domain-containing protein n=1 Tax=Streptomyces sp. AcE210 TaxID=2292703 RepID=UPI001404A374|nr:zinc ribbon domain-containing protein [Streptomyces sp. AcE210]
MYHQGVLPEPGDAAAFGPFALRFQRCAWCSSAVFVRRSLCPNCAGEELTWECSQGMGHIQDYLRRPRKGQLPLLLPLVDLDEGFRVTGRLTAGPLPWPGTRVRFEYCTGGAVPVFSVFSTDPGRAEEPDGAPASGTRYRRWPRPR